MTEQLAFDEVRRQCAAVDDHERSTFALALVPDGSGRELFARAGLARDQDRRVARREPLEAGENGSHGHRGANQIAKAIVDHDLDRALLPKRGDADLGVAEANEGLIVEVDPLNPPRVQEGAVG